MSRLLTPENLCSLIDDHFATLLVFARQWAPSDAEDIVQDAFLQMVKRLPWEGCPEQPVAWLFRVVRNGAIDRHRKEKRRREHEQRCAEERTTWFEVPPDSETRAEEIDAMLRYLSAQQREILVARIWGGLTFDEIAAMTDASRTTVFRQYTEALQTIRDQFRPQ